MATSRPPTNEALVRRLIVTIAAILIGLAVTGSALANARAATGSVKIGGVGYASLGTGVIDMTPGVESVILLNYSYSSKNLKGYTLVDKAGNVVHLCRVVGGIPLNCADNLSDMSDSVTLGARSQTLVNVEILADGAWLGNTGDTLYLKDSVGHVVSTFAYKVS